MFSEGKKENSLCTHIIYKPKRNRKHFFCTGVFEDSEQETERKTEPYEDREAKLRAKRRGNNNLVQIRRHNYL